jgi:hypothetical protein
MKFGQWYQYKKILFLLDKALINGAINVKLLCEFVQGHIILKMKNFI